MTVLIVIIHVMVCVALIMIVLLQTGKGADMGAAFGGGSSQTLFGSTGASTFLSKATTAVAVIFMVTCFILAYISTHRQSSSIMEGDTAPIEQTADESAAPESAAPSAETEPAPEKTE
jgi:preprotein translocase subunit SecG